jgi:DNA-directed RNA polymerase specialized sigma24 family protein
MRQESLVAPKAPSPSSARSNLARVEVRSAIAAELRGRHVRTDDIEDLTHDVIVKALVLPELPASLPECTALVRKIAGDLAIDRMRQRRSRGRYNVGLCGDPDARSTSQFTAAAGADDAIAVRRQLAFVQHQIEAGLLSARQAAILEADADGVPQSHVAERLNVAYKTVRNDLARARRTLRESWASYVTLVLFAIAGFVGWERARPDLENNHVAHPRFEHSLAPREAMPEELADSLRRKALRACAVQQWDDCLDGLNHAAALDPAGDTKPWVQKAKHEAQMHRSDKPPVR